MADTKFSQIAVSGSNLVAADQILGVNGGTTDLLFSGTQIKAFTSASPTLVTPNLGTPSAGVMTNVTGTAAGLTAGNVTTNANLTGVITSVGNATSIASQTGTGTKFVVDTSPTLVTPVIGVASGTSLALGAAATIGANALVVTGTTLHTGNVTITSASLITSGNISAAAWTVSGLRNQMSAASYTDTSSTGTVAAAYTDLFGASTILASSATTYTNYYGSYFVAPVASTNVTMTNKWALGADSINVAGAGAASFGPLTMAGTPFAGTGTTSYPLLYQNGGAAPTSWSTGGTYFGINGVSGFAGNFVDFRVNGSSSRAAIDLNGNMTIAGAFVLGSGNAIQFAGRAFVTSPAAAQTQLGNSDAASPVAQLLRTQGSRAGTDVSIAGANFTVQSGIGTGNVGVSSLIVNGVIGTTTTTSTAQTTAAAITVPGVAAGQLPGAVIGSAAIATNATDGFLYLASGAGTPTGTPTTFTGRVPMYVDTTNSQLWLFLGGAWKQPKTPAGAAIVTWQ